MDIRWKDGFTVNVSTDCGSVVISANKEGLQSLADLFTALSREPAGSHIHLDRFNALEDSSVELIIEHSNPDRNGG